MARIPLGQNTPLTLIGAFTAESGTDQSRDGLTTTSGSATYITGGLQHLRDGNGGSYALRLTTNQGVIFPFGGLTPREVVVAFPLYGEAQTTVNLLRAGTHYQVGLEVLDGNAPRLVRGQSGVSVTALATGTTGYIPSGQYSWCVLHTYIDNSGFADLYVHSYANKPLSFTGDTQESAAFANLDALRFFVDGVSSDVRMDDVLVFARTIYFTTGVNTLPTAEQIITDATTGATARVTFVEGTNTLGVLVVHSVTGTFGLGNTINNVASGGTWTAVASNALANDKASLWVPEGFSAAGTLTSDVAAGWTGATGGGDHYSQLNDWVTTADYVFSATAGQVDQYGSTPPTIPGGSTVIGLIISLWAESNSNPNVSQVDLGYNDGTGNGVGPDQVLASNYGRVDTFWTNNSRTGAAFSTGQITALQPRLISVA